MENPFEMIVQRLDDIERLLNELKTGRVEPTNQIRGGYDLMNVQQVAAYLSLSVQTIYGLVYKREIPNAKRGKRLYFNRGGELMNGLARRGERQWLKLKRKLLITLSKIQGVGGERMPDAVAQFQWGKHFAGVSKAYR